MRFWPCILALLLLARAPAETPALRVTMSTVSVTQCRRGHSSKYGIYVGGKVQIENTSKMPVLVAKQIDVIPSVRAALSEANVKLGIFLFTMHQEYWFGNRKYDAPQLKDFVAIEPGRTQLVEFLPTSIPASSDPSDPDTEQLRPGKYWMQLRFSSLPMYFEWSPRDVAAFNKKWRSVGIVTDERFWTEPFPIDVVLDPNAEDCDSDKPTRP